AVMATFEAGVNEYQTVLLMLPHGEGSPTSEVAPVVLRLLVNGREAIGEGLAKLSFGGGSATFNVRFPVAPEAPPTWKKMVVPAVTATVMRDWLPLPPN